MSKYMVYEKHYTGTFALSGIRYQNLSIPVAFEVIPKINVEFIGSYVPLFNKILVSDRSIRITEPALKILLYLLWHEIFMKDACYCLLRQKMRRSQACFCVCCCSVAESCLTLCDSMDCSTSGLPVLH